MFVRLVKREPALTTEICGKNPVVAPTPWTWRDREVGAPCLVRVGDEVAIFCHGQFGSRDRIGRLTAPVEGFDAGRFAEQAENPLIDTGPAGTPDDLSVRHPSVVWQAGVWYCFYEARDERGGSHVCAAVSCDGRQFAKYPRNPLFPGREPSAVSTRQGFVVFHTSPERGVGVFAAYSGDGVAWTTTPEPVFRPGAGGASESSGVCCPRVHSEQDSYYLFYGGWHDDEGLPTGIGLAVSRDLRHWRLWPHNPLIRAGGAPDWPVGVIWPGGPARIGDTLYLPCEVRGRDAPAMGFSSVGMLVLRGCLPRLTL